MFRRSRYVSERITQPRHGEEDSTHWVTSTPEILPEVSMHVAAHELGITDRDTLWATVFKLFVNEDNARVSDADAGSICRAFSKGACARLSHDLDYIADVFPELEDNTAFVRLKNRVRAIVYGQRLGVYD